MAAKRFAMVGALSSGWTAYDTALSIIQDNAEDLKQLCTHAYPVDQAEKAKQAVEEALASSVVGSDSGRVIVVVAPAGSGHQGHDRQHRDHPSN